MENFKKVVLYTIIIISTASHHCSYAGGDVAEMATMGSIAAVGAVKVAGAVKAGVIAIVASPATPIITGVAVGTAVGIGGYQIYRVYNPTPEEIAQTARFMEQAAQHQARTALYIAQAESLKAQTIEAHTKQEAHRSAEEFKKCMTSNYKFNATAEIPTACNNFARAFALAAGQEKVNETVGIFNKYSGS